MTNYIKKLIKRYLKKHLTAHPKHYYFLRWLADLVKDNKQTDWVCAGIAHWIYETNEHSLLEKFNDLFVIDNNVYIYTHRPGLWIGKGGKTIDSLMYSLNHNIHNVKTHDYQIKLIEMCNHPYSEVIGYAHFYANNW